MKPIIDHIQITVKDLKIAEPFYDKLMPVLGFDLSRKKPKSHEIERGSSCALLWQLLASEHPHVLKLSST